MNTTNTKVLIAIGAVMLLVAPVAAQASVLKPVTVVSDQQTNIVPAPISVNSSEETAGKAMAPCNAAKSQNDSETASPALGKSSDDAAESDNPYISGE